MILRAVESSDVDPLSKHPEKTVIIISRLIIRVSAFILITPSF
jgi:hypothetical protein